MTVDTCSQPVGVALLAQGRFQDALAPLRLALSLGDTAPSTLLNLAIAEDRAGDRARGRRLMRQVAVRLPDWDEPIVRLAESLRAAGENAAAEQAYHQALELNPRRQEALIALGGLLLLRGQATSARDLLLRCCGIAPDNEEAWNTLGLALRATGTFGLALSAFVTAQRLKPDCVDYVLNGVDVTIQAHEGDPELARLSVACEQAPLNPALQIGRGMLLDRMGCRAAAIDALDAATELAPDALLPLRLLGGLLSRSSRVTQAEQVLRRVASLDPDDPQVANDHAVVLMRLHRHAEARAILQDILDRLGPTTPCSATWPTPPPALATRRKPWQSHAGRSKPTPLRSCPGAPCATCCHTTTAPAARNCWRRCARVPPPCRGRLTRLAATSPTPIAAWSSACCPARCARTRWDG
jgi:protein O-GlcNAc transferase